MLHLRVKRESAENGNVKGSREGKDRAVMWMYDIHFLLFITMLMKKIRYAWSHVLKFPMNFTPSKQPVEKVGVWNI